MQTGRWSQEGARPGRGGGFTGRVARGSQVPFPSGGDGATRFVPTHRVSDYPEGFLETSFVHSFMHSFTYSFIYTLIHSFHSLIRLFTHSFAHSFISSFTCWHPAYWRSLTPGDQEERPGPVPEGRVLSGLRLTEKQQLAGQRAGRRCPRWRAQPRRGPQGPWGFQWDPVLSEDLTSLFAKFTIGGT